MGKRIDIREEQNEKVTEIRIDDEIYIDAINRATFDLNNDEDYITIDIGSIDNLIKALELTKKLAAEC
jgi:hypothetical protein